MQFWVSGLGATGFAVFCVVGALWPAGDTHVGGMVVGHPGGALARGFFLGLAGFSVFLAWQQFRTLVVRLPGAWGDSNEHFDLSDFSGAEIVKDEDRDDWLALVGRDGAVVHRLLSALRWASSDLVTAAQVLNCTINPNRPMPSVFTRVSRDELESDRGFAVRAIDGSRPSTARGRTRSPSISRPAWRAASSAAPSSRRTRSPGGMGPCPARSPFHRKSSRKCSPTSLKRWRSGGSGCWSRTMDQRQSDTDDWRSQTTSRDGASSFVPPRGGRRGLPVRGSVALLTRRPARVVKKHHPEHLERRSPGRTRASGADGR